MPMEAEKTRKTNAPSQTDQSGGESASNSAQPVEAKDKSRNTQNAASQKTALQQNVEQSSEGGKATAQQPAAQHATGSFTGDQDAAADKGRGKP